MKFFWPKYIVEERTHFELETYTSQLCILQLNTSASFQGIVTHTPPGPRQHSSQPHFLVGEPR